MQLSRLDALMEYLNGGAHVYEPSIGYINLFRWKDQETDAPGCVLVCIKSGNSVSGCWKQLSVDDDWCDVWLSADPLQGKTGSDR